jgi:hypothetical protein
MDDELNILADSEKSEHWPRRLTETKEEFAQISTSGRLLAMKTKEFARTS